MSDYGIYWRNFARERKQGDWPCLHWFTNSDRLEKTSQGDRLWLFTSGDTCGMSESQLAYLVEIFVVQSTAINPGMDPDYPSENFGFVIQGDKAHCLHVDPPLLVDEFFRDKGTDAEISIGKVRQGPWKIKEEVVGKLTDYLAKERNDLFMKIFPGAE